MTPSSYDIHVTYGSQESGVRSQESGVRSQESGVRSQNKLHASNFCLLASVSFFLLTLFSKSFIRESGVRINSMLLTSGSRLLSPFFYLHYFQKLLKSEQKQESRSQENPVDRRQKHGTRDKKIQKPGVRKEAWSSFWLLAPVFWLLAPDS